MTSVKAFNLEDQALNAIRFMDFGKLKEAFESALDIGSPIPVDLMLVRLAEDYTTLLMTSPQVEHEKGSFHQQAFEYFSGLANTFPDDFAPSDWAAVNAAIANALHGKLTAEFKSIHAIRLLREHFHHYDVNACPPVPGNSLLMISVAAKVSAADVQYLIDIGADVQQCSADRGKAIHFIDIGMEQNIVAWSAQKLLILMSAGADPEERVNITQSSGIIAALSSKDTRVNGSFSFVDILNESINLMNSQVYGSKAGPVPDMYIPFIEVITQHANAQKAISAVEVGAKRRSASI